MSSHSGQASSDREGLLAGVLVQLTPIRCSRATPDWEWPVGDECGVTKAGGRGGGSVRGLRHLLHKELSQRCVGLPSLETGTHILGNSIGYSTVMSIRQDRIKGSFGAGFKDEPKRRDQGCFAGIRVPQTIQVYNVQVAVRHTCMVLTGCHPDPAEVYPWHRSCRVTLRPCATCTASSGHGKDVGTRGDCRPSTTMHSYEVLNGRMGSK